MLTSFIRPDAPPVNTKSDTELQYCIDNREKYLSESVLAAVNELQRRGIEFSEEGKTVIEEDMQARAEIAEEAGNVYGGIFSGAYKKCLVDDPDAYVFYSRRIIKLFTFFFGAFFGSIMMAMNIHKTKNTPGTVLVLVFGITVTIVEVVIPNFLSLNTAANIFFAFINAILIDLLFWRNYIGQATLYKPRTYQTPLLIGIIISVLMIALIMYSISSTHVMDSFGTKELKK
jgi:hypothetical protein